MSVFRRIPAALFLCFVAVSAVAAPAEFSVLFDSDNDVFTGCSTSGFSGVDFVAVTHVETASPARVTLVTSQQCVGGSLSIPQTLDAGGWPVRWNASTGEASVETRFPTSILGGRRGPFRVAVIGGSGGITATLLTRDDGGPILFPGAPPRRRIASPPGSVRSVTPDDSDEDWAGLAPLVAGSPTSGGASFRFINVYGFSGAQQIFFRFHVQASPNAPSAADDSYSTTPGTPLSVGGPGILGNDVDPRGRPLTAALVDDVNHGTLVLNGNGSFSYTDDGSGAARDHFTYRASNGEQQSNLARVDIGVGSRPNRRPSSGDDVYEVPFGGSLSVIPPGVLGNDNDPDRDPLQAVLVAPPSHGTATLNANGSFTYNHSGITNERDRFTYRATDGTESSRETTVHLNIRDNAPPVAVDDAYTASEGGLLNIGAPGILSNDSDPDTPFAALAITLVSNPSHGSVSLGADGSFAYVHDGSETLADEFTYRLSDGSSSSTAVVRLSIVATNDAPVAVNDTYGVTEDGTLNVGAPGVLSNDTDSDSTIVAAILASATTNGTLSLNANGAFTYTPNANFAGVDSFTYRASDGTATSGNIATVTINVTQVNDAPNFTAGANVSVAEDSGAYNAVWATAINAGPANESGQSLTFTVTNNNNALFSVQPSIASNGTLSFTPAANASGVATVTVVLTDGGTPPQSTPAASFTITVSAVNDPPSFAGGSNVTVAEDSGAFNAPSATSISAGPADESAQTVTFAVTNNNNGLFAVQPSISATGVLTFTPAANANGTATVSVIASDNGTPPATSAAQTFTITVTPVNDAPSFVSGGNVAGSEDAPYSSAWATSVLAGPADEASQTLSFTATNDNNALFAAQPAITAAGVLSFTPAPNASGSATVTVTLRDNGGVANGGVDASGPQTFTITIAAVNDAPDFTAGGNVVVNEDGGAYNAAWATAISPGPADESAQTVSFNVTNDNNALFAVQPAIGTSGTLTFTPAANASGTTTVTVSLTDNGTPAATSAPRTFTITITAVNDEPSFVAGPNVTVAEDSGSYSAAWATTISAGPNETSQTVSFTATNDNNSLFAVQPSVSPAGVLAFTPATNANGSAQVTVFLGDNGGTANGGDDTSSSVTFTITVTAVNDVPSFTGGANVSVNEDSGLYSSGWATLISAGPADETAQSVSFNVSNDNNGLFAVQPAVAADGTLTFTPAAHAFGSATVTVTATDNGAPPATSAAQTFTITVNGVNDEPAFTGGGNVATGEDTPYNAPWASSISSGPLETQTLTFVVTSNTNSALFATQPSITAAGILSFTPAANTTGTATITVELRDDGGTANGGDDTSAAVTFDVNVTPVNDAPNAISQSVTTDEDGALLITLTATDVEGDSLTFTIGAASNGAQSAPSAPNCVVSAGTSTCTTTLTYTPNPDFAGAASFTFTAFDGVNTSNVATVSITVNGVNDAPVNTVPAGPIVVSEGTPLVFSTGGGNAISVADIDAGTNAIQVTLQSSAGHGTIALATTAGLTFSAGDGTDDESMTFTGTIAAINAALNGVSFTSAAGYEGAATVTITTNDLGATGSGGPLTDTDAISLTVQRPNDPPVNTVPGAQTVNEDATLTLTGATAISIADPDAGSASVRVSLSVTNGVLTVSSTTGLTFTAGDGTADPAMTFEGTLANINASLSTVTYQPAANLFGSDTLTVLTDDLGNSGTGGPQTDSDTVAITVNAVNDEPVFTAGGNVTVAEDSGAYNAAWATGVSAGAANEAAQTLTFQLTNDNTALFSVQPAINAAGVLTFTTASNAFGVANLSVFLQDNGGTSNGGDDTSGTALFTITVTAVNDAPVAGADAFDTIGNTELRVDLAAASATPHASETTASGIGALGNDSDPVEGNPFQVTGIVGCVDSAAPFDCVVAGQHIVMEADGKFTFTPAPGAVTGSFQYTITDAPAASAGSPASATGTVSITIREMVWYVDGDAAPGGSGTSKSPLNVFSAINGAGGAGDADDADDFIFVHTSAISGSLELEANQKLWGEGYGLTLPVQLNGNAPTTLLVAAGTAPTVTSAANTISATAAFPAEIRGLTLGSTGGNAIDVSTSGAYTGAPDLLITGNTFSGSVGETIDINAGATAGTRTVVVQNNIWSGVHTGNGIDATAPGANTLIADVANNFVIANGTGILIGGGGGPIVVRNLANNTIDGAANIGMSLQNLTFDGNPLTGGIDVVPFGTTIVGSAGNPTATYGILMSSVTGSVGFTSFFVFSGTQAALHVAGTSPLTMSVTTTANSGILAATNGPAADIASATVDLQISQINSAGSATNGVRLNNVAGTFSAGSGSTITNAASADFEITGGTANVTYNGTITDDLGQLVRIVSATGGTKLFAGAITDNFDGDGGVGAAEGSIQLASNTGATVTFSGGLSLSTGANAAFNATGGGTVNVTNAGTNRIQTTSGIPLSVQNTIIGASGLNFQSVNANGAPNGIVLLNTGAAGLTVSGTGAAGSGGTIQNTTGRGASFAGAANIALNFMNFTNAGTTDLDATNGGLSTGDNLASNAAIHLENVSTVALNTININGGAEQGINGNNVSNFTLTNSSISNVGNAADEDNIHFFNMTGTSAITNTVLTQTTGDDNLNLQTQSGTLTLTISGGSATGGGVQLGSGYLFGIRGTTNATINFSSANASNNFSGGIVADAFDNATMNLSVTNSTSSSNNDQLSVSAGDNSRVDLTANGNTLSSPNAADFVVVSLLGSAFDNGFIFDATINNNNISVGNGRTADAIVVNNAGGGQMNVAITNNTIDYAGTQRAILVQAGQDGNGANSVTITGNNIDIELDGAGNAVAGILAQSAVTGPGNTSSLCIDIGGAAGLANTFTHSLGGSLAAGDIRVRQRNDGTVRLPGYVGLATDAAAVIAYLNGRNAEVSASTATFDSSGFGGGAACTQP